VHGPGIDEPLEVEHGSGEILSYHADGLGSIVRMTDTQQNVVQEMSREYDAFGNLLEGAAEEGYAFTGREWDAETGLYYYRARYYDPKIGRFLSEDPIQWQAGDVNFYAYALNNPTNLVDPFGLQSADLKNEYDLIKPPQPVPPDPGGWADAAAWAAEARNFPGVLDPYGGGFRHCMAACLLKRRYGPAGEAMAWVRQALYEEMTSEDSHHDAAAEQRGFRCSAGGQTCEQECLKWFPPYRGRHTK
jgi:RHS repeat-associated protein